MKALVLNYHAIVRQPLTIPDWCFLAEDAFLEQMEELAASADVVRLADLANRPSDASDRPLVALTFDDGFLNNHEVAFPILRRLNLPATVFVCTDFIDSDDTIWFCRVNQAISETELSAMTWEGETLALSGVEARSQASARVQTMLKRWPQPDLLRAVLELGLQLGVDTSAHLSLDSPYRLLTRAAIREMHASKLIDFGAHTRTHAILSRLSAPEQRREVAGSLSAVQDLCGPCPRLFAYPNGTPADYDRATVDLLAALGVDMAVTTTHGANDDSTPRLELRRYGVGRETTLDVFRDTIHGLSSSLSAP